MSHAVYINYEALSIECRSICEVASKQLCRIDELLTKIDKKSTSLQGDETEGMKHALKEQAALIRSRIDEINKGYNVNAARELSREVNAFTTNGIAGYEALLDGLLSSKMKDRAHEMKMRLSGATAHDKDFSHALSKITDEVLKGYIYMEWLDDTNAGKSFEELKGLAEDRMNNAKENYFRNEQKRIIGEMESDMRDAKLDDETIASVMAIENADVRTRIEQMRRKATDEIVGEAVRKKTLKAIIDCIEKKGFIVDRKNIKHQKEKNEVKMVAQKASGERADFTIMLDGKFIYHFDGYEGHACQEDIQPFMKDLEDIYGIKVVDQKEIWKNPDKISTQKYQQMKTRTNKD